MKHLLILIFLPNLLFAQSYFLKIKTQKQGELKGESTIQRHIGKIEIIDYSFEISSLKGTKKSVKPLTIRKHVDGTSTSLYNAFFTNDLITTLSIESYIPRKENTVPNLFTISCKNALVIGIQQIFDPISKKIIEEIAFEISDFKFENQNNQSAVESKLNINN